MQSRSLRVHLSQLRRSLAKDFITARRVGTYKTYSPAYILCKTFNHRVLLPSSISTALAAKIKHCRCTKAQHHGARATATFVAAAAVAAEHKTELAITDSEVNTTPRATLHRVPEQHHYRRCGLESSPVLMEQAHKQAHAGLNLYHQVARVRTWFGIVAFGVRCGQE